MVADTIRSWLGDFSKISSLAKYASRLGQAFSKTFPTIPVFFFFFFLSNKIN